MMIVPNSTNVLSCVVSVINPAGLAVREASSMLSLATIPELHIFEKKEYSKPA